MLNKCLLISLTFLGHGLVYGQSVSDTMYLNTIDVLDSIRSRDHGVTSFAFDTSMYSYTSSIHAGEFLQSNTSMYIKDKGPGASASMSFRGNGASHTKVYWEGISIDNSMLGQSDVSLFQSNRHLGLEFIKGGNSLDLGAGGFGGILNFKPGSDSWNKQRLEMGVEAGSFGRRSTEVNVLYGNGKFKFESFLTVGIADNDFPYRNYVNASETELRENANTQKIQWLPKFSWRLNSKNELSVGMWLTETERQVPSAIGTSHGNAVQEDNWRKIMASWKYTSSKTALIMKSAYMDDELNYRNKEQGIDSYNRILSWKNLLTFKNKISKNLHNEMQLKADIYEVHTVNYKDVVDDYNIGINEALIYSIRKWHIKAGLRAEKWSNSDYAVMPSLFALTSPITSLPNLGLFTDISYNVRFPSFNDKYWLDLGNPDLKKERAQSAELGVQYASNSGEIFQYNAKLTYFMSDIEDLIIWMPDDNAIWRPINQDELTNNGIDLEAEFSLHRNDWLIKTIFNYAYTNSIPSSTDGKSHQQIYVPKNKVSYTVNTMKKGYFIDYEQVITSEIYIYSDNTSYLPISYPANLEFGKSIDLKGSDLVLSAAILNVFNEPYQYVAHMPMPLRNYRLSIYFNIN